MAYSIHTVMLIHNDRMLNIHLVYCTFENSRQLTRKGTGTDTSAPTGKENEGVPARASGLKSK